MRSVGGGVYGNCLGGAVRTVVGGGSEEVRNGDKGGVVEDRIDGLGGELEVAVTSLVARVEDGVKNVEGVKCEKSGAVDSEVIRCGSIGFSASYIWM